MDKNILDLEITKKIITPQSIFYIGLGKTGSASIFHSFPNRPTFHYHNYTYFNYVNNGKLKSNQDLYNFISNIGYMLDFKPIIIEATRNPYKRAISALFHNYYNSKNKNHKDLLNMNIDKLKKELEKYLYMSPLYKTVIIPDNINLIILKLEEKEKWNDILKKYNINDYTPINKNVNNNDDYKKLKEIINNNIYKYLSNEEKNKINNLYTE